MDICQLTEKFGSGVQIPTRLPEFSRPSNVFFSTDHSYITPDFYLRPDLAGSKPEHFLR
jgi:hypothetical protein